MRIFTRVILSYLIVMTTFVLIIFSVYKLIQYSELTMQADAKHFESLDLADSICQSSEDLTKMARSYLATGDKKYKQYFYDILAIRQGEKARPTNYNDLYWNFIVGNKTFKEKSGKKESLDNVLKSAGITERELNKLQEAEELSNKLAVLESKAFAEAEKSNQFSTSSPQTILYSPEYHAAKSLVMETAQEFITLVDQRTLNTYSENQRKLELFSNIIVALTLFAIIFSIISVIRLQKLIINPLVELSKTAKKVSEGNIDAKADIHLKDEIGVLAKSFNQMNKKLSENIRELTAQKNALDKHAMVSVSNIAGEITYINNKYSEISGFTNNDIIGENQKMISGGHYPQQFYIDVWKTINNNDVWHGQVRHQKKDGSIYWTSTTIAPILDKNDIANGVISISTDITEQKSTTRELQKAKEKAEEATKTKSNFLANMSHEIRTPMNAIIGFSELALNLDLPETAHSYIKKVNNSANALIAIINEVLDFSKIEAGKLKLEHIGFDLFDTVQDALQIISLQAQAKGLKLKFNFNKNLNKYYKGDPTRIRQLIINTVGNAIKFTEYGHIEINISPIRNDWILFSITDTGIGMTDDQIAKVFDSFTQADGSTERKYGGTGLGTTICKKIVEAMGGEIWIESQIGVGSSFFFSIELESLPKSETLNLPANKNNISISPRLFNILLVEDNQLNGELIELNLEQIHGHNITWVTDGQQALDNLEEHYSDYDLILMDNQMPVLGGLEAASLIRDMENKREIDKPITIIALTASASMEDQEKCIKSGMNSFVQKPIKFSKLITVIEEVVPKGIGVLNNNNPNLTKQDKEVSLAPISHVADITKGLNIWHSTKKYAQAMINFNKIHHGDGEKLLQLIAIADYESAIKICHSLKGLSLGLSDITNLSEKCEIALNKNEIATAQKLAQKLSKALKESSSAIENIEIVTDEQKKIEFDPDIVTGYISDLLQALQEDNPDPVEPILKLLVKYIEDEQLAPITNSVDMFDFRQAEINTRELANSLNIKNIN